METAYEQPQPGAGAPVTLDGILALVAGCMTLAPGHAIIMRTPPARMKVGEALDMGIERIGVLRAPIVAEAL